MLFKSALTSRIALGLASLIGFASYSLPSVAATERVRLAINNTVERSDLPSVDFLEPSTIYFSQRRRRYRPPSDARLPRRSHSGGGVRGCGEEILAIAPRSSSIGQTTSTRPTLTWYNYSNSAEPLELHLYRYEAEAAGAEAAALTPILIKPLAASQVGYASYTLSERDPALEPGQTYFWQVILYCDPNLEEVGRWTSADIQVVLPPATVSEQLADDSLRNAEIYAEAGFWYDAIAQISNLEDSMTNAFLQTLLLELAELEGEAIDDSAEAIRDQLRQVVEQASP